MGCTLHCIEDIDGFPFLPLGGVDRRQNEVVLVGLRSAGLARDGIRRVKGNIGEKGCPAVVAASNARQLAKIVGARHGIRVALLHVRLVPSAHQLDLGGPSGAIGKQPLEHVDKSQPAFRRTQRRAKLSQCVGAPQLEIIQGFAGGSWADAVQQLKDAKAGHAVAQVLRPA